MSNKTKVLIITRTNEYYENGKIKSEIYGKHIKEQIYDNMTESRGIDVFGANTKRFLAVFDLVRDFEKKTNGTDYLSDFFYNNYGIIVDLNLRTSDEKKTSGMGQMLKSGNDKVKDAINGEMHKMGDVKCFVRFDEGDNDGAQYEIIMLLWDKLGRDSNEQISPFGLFVEEVCKDCGISDTKDVQGRTNNILYIHDCQLIGRQDDLTVWDRSNPVIGDGFKNESYYHTFESYFDYVATFGHLSTGGTFQNQILQFKFGPTMADKISRKESEATSFKMMRIGSDSL